MSGKRILLVLVALTLWLPLVLPAFFKPAEDSSWQQPFHTNLEVRLASRAMRISEKYHLPFMGKQITEILDNIDFNKAQSTTIHSAASLYYLNGRPQKAQKLLSKISSEEADSVTEALIKICQGTALASDETQLAYNLLNLQLKELNKFYGDPLSYSFVMRTLQKGAVQPELNGRLEDSVINLQQKADHFLLIIGAWIAFVSLSFIFLATLTIKSLSNKARAFSQETSEIEDPYIWKPIPTLYLFVALNWLGACLSALLAGFLFSSVGRSSTSLPLVLFCSQIIVYIISVAVLALLIKYVCQPNEAEAISLSQAQGLKKAITQLLRALHLQEFKASYLVYGCAGFALACLTAALMAFLTSFFTQSSVQSNNILLTLLMEAPEPIFWLLFFLVVSGPLYEEIVYRGLLFSGLSKTATVTGAAAISSLMFSAVHGDPQGILVLGGLGAVFCALRHYTGSLWPSVIAHSLWNCQVVIYVLSIGR